MARAIPLDPDSRRAQLLASARVVFARHGYQGASVADIIAEAGVARGTFYNYFESKRVVFQAVLDELIDALAAAVTPIDPAGDIPEELRQNLDRVLTILTQENDVARLLFADAVGLDAEGDEALRAFYGAAAGRIESALIRGQAMGLVRNTNVQLTARCLLGMLKEPLFQAWVHGERLDQDALIGEMIRIVMGGVWG